MNPSRLIVLLYLLSVCSMPRTASAAAITSITLDPEDASGTTTNAPGAWSTNASDPLSQLGVRSGGVFLNNPGVGFDLGEVSIPLQPGLNTFSLYANGLAPANPFYGLILFFDGALMPGIAAHNSNGGVAGFVVQPAGANLICSPNGGAFFCAAPGPPPVYVFPDGSRAELLSFTVDSTHPGTDLVSFVNIGANGVPDTTAQFTIRYDQVPEPSTFWLLLPGLVLALKKRRTSAGLA